MGSSRGCPLAFTIWHLGSPGGSDPGGTAGPGQSHTAVYDLPHFRPLLLVTQSSAGTTGQGAVDRCEDQEVRITGGSQNPQEGGSAGTLPRVPPCRWKGYLLPPHPAWVTAPSGSLVFCLSLARRHGEVPEAVGTGAHQGADPPPALN